MTDRQKGVFAAWLEPLAMLAAATAGTAALAASGGPAREWRWLAIPALWLAAAAAPRLWRKDAWQDIRLWTGRPAEAVWTGLWATAAMAVVAAAFVWAFFMLNREPPLRPAIAPGEWLAWSLYQFLYVAVSEETFFRGYFQGRAEQALGASGWARGACRWGGMFASAGAFGAAHVLAGGAWEGATVAVPGLFFGWLRVRTGGVAVPIFAHGAANVIYAALCALA